MQEILDALLLNENIISLKEMIKQDPIFQTIAEQLPIILNELSSLMNFNMPVLDLNPAVVYEANTWIRDLQIVRDKICQYEVTLRIYEYRIDHYLNLAHNICMVQPQLEGLRSNEQRNAYIEQVFQDLWDKKNYMKVSMKKLDIISNNCQQAYYSFIAQQKNLQFLATVHKSYGTPIS
jgi:hypothetical protein